MQHLHRRHSKTRHHLGTMRRAHRHWHQVLESEYSHQQTSRCHRRNHRAVISGQYSSKETKAISQGKGEGKIHLQGPLTEYPHRRQIHDVDPEAKYCGATNDLGLTFQIPKANTSKKEATVLTNREEDVWHGYTHTSPTENCSKDKITWAWG